MAVRILHVVGGMNRGGAETWLINLIRNMDSTKFKFDFLVWAEGPCAYDEEIRALGGNIIFCPIKNGPVGFFLGLGKILKQNGPYDIIHTHVQYFGGLALWIANLHGVPVRIAHSHNDTRASEAERKIGRRLYRWSMRALIQFNMTQGLGVSVEAAEDLFGNGWRGKNVCIQYCGIDLAPYTQKYDSMSIRAELGIPSGAKVVCHVGRLAEVKNHEFLLEIMFLLMRDDPFVWLLLVGDGPLRRKLEAKAATLGIKSRTIFAGSRSDVPRMLFASDVFFFPSLWEGFGLVMLEAQAAGLRCVASTAFTRECDAIPESITRVDLSGPKTDWVNALKASLASPRTTSPVVRLMRSGFDIRSTSHELSRYYGAD